MTRHHLLAVAASVGAAAFLVGGYWAILDAVTPFPESWWINDPEGFDMTVGLLMAVAIVVGIAAWVGDTMAALRLADSQVRRSR